MNNVMVDIETLATSTNAVILSIGAVRFGEELGDEFYINVDPSSQRWREVSPDTVQWWAGQGQAAQDKLTEEPVVSLRQALVMFKEFLKHGDKLWSNGPTFDEMILRSAFEQLNGVFPLNFWNSRCCRTEFDLGKRLGVKRIMPDLKHDALSDAIAQAQTVIDIRARVRDLQGA